MLQKEAQWSIDAWSKPLMPVITPKLIGLVEASDVAGLLTYGTENVGLIPREELVAYQKLREEIVSEYARQKGFDSALLERDPVVIDMINRAVSHSMMREHIRDRVYGLANLESVASVDKLNNWLRDGNAPKEVVNELVGMQPLYRQLEDEVASYDRKPTVLAHNDVRLENVFASPLGVRPLGDAGLAKPSTEVFDLGKMEVVNMNGYVELYGFARNWVEQNVQGENFELSGADIMEMQRQAPRVGFTNAMRMAHFKVSRGLNAVPYVGLAQKYCDLLQ